MNKYQALQKQVKSKLHTLEQYRKSGKITEVDYQTKKRRIEKKAQEIEMRLRAEDSYDDELDNIDSFEGFKESSRPVGLVPAKKQDLISVLAKVLPLMLALLFVAAIISFAIKNQSEAEQSQDVAQTSQPSVRKYTNKQETMDKLAQAYLNTHKNRTLTSVTDKAHHYKSGNLTLDKSKLIIGYLFDMGASDGELDNIASAKINRGMTVDQVLYAWGDPNGYSNHESSLGLTMQLTYGNVLDGGADYVYITNNKVTSWSSASYN